MVRMLLVLVLLADWGAALWWWSALPERVPIHFDLNGVPNGWAERSLWWWFLLPALGTGLCLGFGVLLPRWIRALAKSNSRWLNVPHKERLAALPEAARVRAVAASTGWLEGLAVLVAVLFGWIVNGSALVAVGTWSRLPSWPSFLLVGAVVASGAGMAFASSRAVQREVDRLGG